MSTEREVCPGLEERLTGVPSLGNRSSGGRYQGRASCTSSRSRVKITCSPGHLPTQPLPPDRRRLKEVLSTGST